MNDVSFSRNQTEMSEYNRSRLIHILYSRGICSRAELAREMGMTPAAITKITAKLIDLGVIAESGEMEGLKNRRSVGLEVKADSFEVIGVKFARSLVEIGVFTISGRQLSALTLSTADTITPRITVEAVKREVRKLVAQRRAIIAVGIAVPGPYLRNEGYIGVMTSMPEWHDINFIDEFADAFDVPAFIEQDARAAALAELLFCPDIAGESIAYYLIGEGVGLGLMERGMLTNGFQGAATEIGHVSIDVNGERCECGNRGCLEMYCSATAIHADLIENHPHLIANVEAMSHSEACLTLFHLADQGNDEAITLVNRIATFAGFGCVTIINAYNPETIIIGDIISHAGQRLLDGIGEVVAERVIPELAEAVDIRLSTLATDATLLGAAAVATDQFLRQPDAFKRR